MEAANLQLITSHEEELDELLNLRDEEKEEWAKTRAEWGARESELEEASRLHALEARAAAERIRALTADKAALSQKVTELKAEVRLQDRSTDAASGRLEP